MTKKTKLIMVAVFCVILLAMIGLAAWFMPKSVDGAKHITVQIVADDATEEFEFDTDLEFLGEILMEEGLVEGEAGDYGLYITVANGREVDASKNEWWCITKNGGEEVMTAADATPLLDGETYELTLSTY